MGPTRGGPGGSARGQRALSPLIGMVLLIAIVVAMSAVVGGVALGFSDSLAEPAPQIAFQTEFHANGADNGGKPYFTIAHRGGDLEQGDSLYIRDEDGNTVTWEDVWTTDPTASPTDYAHIDGDGSDDALNHVCEAGQTYQVIEKADGRTYVIAEYEVPREPDPGQAGWC